jgi:hypothetical protein
MTTLLRTTGAASLYRDNGEYRITFFDGTLVEAFTKKRDAEEFFSDLALRIARRLPEPDYDAPCCAAVTCPTCGGDPDDPFTECLTCEETMKIQNSRSRKPFGPISPLAERLAASIMDDSPSLD